MGRPTAAIDIECGRWSVISETTTPRGTVRVISARGGRVTIGTDEGGIIA
jgi:hypothetical protein